MRYLFLALSLFLFLACSPKSGKEAGFLIEKRCNGDLNATMTRLKKLLHEKKLTIFNIFDHGANAKKVGMGLHPNVVVSFGDPKVGTKLMQCNPSMGLDLPLRIDLHTDYEGIVTLSYTNPTYWSLKHNIKEKTCLEIVRKLAIGMDLLTDKVAGK